MGFTDYLTVEGQRLIAKSISNSLPITFTRVVMGTGYMNEGDVEKNVSEVITPAVTLDVTSVTMSGNESVIISTYFKNEELAEGFYFREKGIYLQVGAEEVLGIYGNAGSLAEYIDTAEVCIIEKMIRTVLTMSTDELENVTLLDGVSADTPIPFKEAEELEELKSGETLKVLFGKLAKGIKQLIAPEYTEATSLQKLVSGEKLSVAFGKIAKLVGSAIAHFATKATLNTTGHVKLSDSSAVTDSTGLALPATEKNAAIGGTLANQISKVNSDIILNSQTLGYTKKNLLKNSGTTQMSNGVTFTVNNDGSVVAENTATTSNGDFFVIPVSNMITLPKGEYIVSGCPEGGSEKTYLILVISANDDDENGNFEMSERWRIAVDYGNSAKFTLLEDTKIAVVCRICMGYEANGTTFFPMIRNANIVDDTYESYYIDTIDSRLKELEAPIYTGATSLQKLVSGENLSVAFGKIARLVSSAISHFVTKATLNTTGHVKLSDSSAVTDSTGFALPATEKNAAINGTLANQISKVNSDLTNSTFRNRGDYPNGTSIGNLSPGIYKTYPGHLPAEGTPPGANEYGFIDVSGLGQYPNITYGDVFGNRASWSVMENKWAGQALKDDLGKKQDASTAITTSNIGSQSVNKASYDSGGYHIHNTFDQILDDLGKKQDLITGGISNVVNDNFNPNIILRTNGNGKMMSSSVPASKLDFLKNVTSDIQNQIDTSKSDLDISSISSSINSTYFYSESENSESYISIRKSGKIAIANINLVLKTALTAGTEYALASLGSPSLYASRSTANCGTKVVDLKIYNNDLNTIVIVPKENLLVGQCMRGQIMFFVK